MMRNTGILLLTAGTALFASSVVHAQEETDQEQSSRQLIEPEVIPRKIDEDLIDTEDFEIGVYLGVMSVEDFGANMVYGVRGAYHLTEDLFFEANLAFTDTSVTSFERLSGNVQLIEENDRRLTYYNLSLGYNFLPGEAFLGGNYAFNTNFYLVAGMGAVDFAGDNRLAINFGWGYQFLATDWISVHLGVRDHIFEIDLLGDEQITNNLEFTSQISFFF